MIDPLRRPPLDIQGAKCTKATWKTADAFAIAQVLSRTEDELTLISPDPPEVGRPIEVILWQTEGEPWRLLGEVQTSGPGDLFVVACSRGATHACDASPNSLFTALRAPLAAAVAFMRVPYSKMSTSTGK